MKYEIEPFKWTMKLAKEKARKEHPTVRVQSVEYIKDNIDNFLFNTKKKYGMTLSSINIDVALSEDTSNKITIAYFVSQGKLYEDMITIIAKEIYQWETELYLQTQNAKLAKTLPHFEKAIK